MKIGLLGIGSWGHRIKQKLINLMDSQLVDLVWFGDSKTRWKEDKLQLDLVDWIFVATPNDTHYDIVKDAIKLGKNVFCTKPLTPTHEQSLELFELADKHKVKLYVDDVFNFRLERDEILQKIDDKTKIKIYWSHPGVSTQKQNKSYMFDLLYHDLYLLYPIFCMQAQNNIDWPNIDNMNFTYEKSSVKKHTINDIDFTHKDDSNDALLEMIIAVAAGMVDYKYNRNISLFCNAMIEEIGKK